MPDFYEDIDVPDARDDIADQQVEYHQGQIPDWEANAGDPATLLIEATAEQHSETRVLLKNRLRDAFADLLETVYGIPMLAALPAVANTTWVVSDTAGYTIPEGVSIDVSGQEFRVTQDVTIPVGASSTGVGEVPVIAQDAGADATGLTGEASLIDTTLGFDVDTILVVGATSGGVDGETRDDFIDRGAELLTIYAGEPILPRDVEVFARQTAGVWRAVAIDLLAPGVNEKQTIVLGGTGLGGTFTLSFGGQTTVGIAPNAAAATVQGDLQALSSIGVGNVTVTGGPFPAMMTVEFVGSLAETNVAALTCTSSLTGTSPTVTIATSVGGVAAATNVARNTTVAVQGSDGLPVGSAVRTELDATLQAHREINFVFNVIDPTYTPIDVTVQARCLPGWDTATVQAQVADAIARFLDPSLWGLPPTGETRAWVNKTKVYMTDLVAAIENADGVDHIEPGTLSFGRHGTTLATSDVTLPGHAPLPQARTVTVTALAP